MTRLRLLPDLTPFRASRDLRLVVGGNFVSEDEARMLGRPVVEPQHLLLALTRHGNARALLGERGVSGSDVYAAIIRSWPVGDDLVLGVVPRSPETNVVLERAVDLAAERGVLGPSSERDRVADILRAVGITDPVTLVDSMPTPDSGPGTGRATRPSWSSRRPCSST